MRIKYLHNTRLIVIALLCFSISTFAQYSSEEEMKSAANTMFEDGNYVGSLKLYSQLLSTYPKDANLNYKYGTCVLFGSRDKDDAIRYLEFAITKAEVDPVAFYYLAKGYQHNYEFSNAIIYYEKFNKKASAKNQNKLDTERAIEMCRNGEGLLTSMANIGVLSKKEIKESEFFRSYKLSGIGGKVIVKPEQFITKLDKKNKDKSVVYIGTSKNLILFSSYGKKGNNKDIYKSVKSSAGEWSEPVLFSSSINSKYDEDYPYLHPDGKTLYFSSKGYSSMGGYDVFKSTLNTSTGIWSAPENLDFPINTPDDDILYISDMDNKLAYFASSRASQQGELTVYNVAVKSVPLNHSVIKGFFLAEANPSSKSATITVRGTNSDRRYGVYKSHDVSGEYLLMFPTNGGKFKILVETSENSPVHSAIIDIPKLDGFRALKQELRLVGEGDDEKLVVKNLFDESDEFDITDPLVVQNIVKQRAKMEVNLTPKEIAEIEEERKEDALIAADNLTKSIEGSLDNLLNKSVYKSLSDDDLANKSDETASKIIEQTRMSQQNAITSYQIATKKSGEAKSLYTEYEQLKSEAESSSSESDKSAKTTLANQKRKEASQLTNEVAALLAVAKTLDNEVIERESDINKVKTLQKSIKNNITNNERKLAEEDLAQLDKISEASYHNESALANEAKIANDKLAVAEEKYNYRKEDVVDLNDRSSGFALSKNTLIAKRATTNKKKEIEAIDNQIKQLELDKEDVEFELKNAIRKLKITEGPYLKTKNETATTNAVIAMLNDGVIDNEIISEPGKLQLERDVTFFKKEGLVGDYQDQQGGNLLTTNNTSVNQSSNNEDVNTEITSSGVLNGILSSSEAKTENANYNKQYNKELAEFVGEETYESTKDKVKIHENWMKDIESEIVEKKTSLSIANEGDKNKLRNEIAVLDNNLLEQQEFVSTYNLQAETLKNEEISVADLINDGEANTEITSLIEDTEENAKEEPVAETNELLENTTEESTAYKAKYKSELAEISNEDTYENTSLKAKVYENWANDLRGDIAEKRQELSVAKSVDKNDIENEIAVLQSNLSEQEEFASLFSLHAESLQSGEPITSGQINNDGAGSATKIIIEEADPAFVAQENELNTTNYKKKYADELATIGEEETYESSARKAKVYENWIADIENDILTKKTALTIAKEEDKVEIENSIAVLENDLSEQKEFASLYAMQAETFRTEDIASTEINSEKQSTIESLENNTTNENVTTTTIAPYEDKYKAELESFGIEETPESSNRKAKIYENWIADIENDIVNKKTLLESSSEEEKSGVDSEIAVLENKLEEQKEFASLYEMQAEELKIENGVSVDAENNDPAVNTTSNGIEVGDKNDPTNYKENYINELAKVDDEETFENVSLKATVYKKWVTNIEEDLSIKRTSLTEANENDKNDIENEIAVLESDLIEKKEFADLFEMHATSLDTGEPIASGQITNDTENATNIIVEDADPGVIEPEIIKGRYDDFKDKYTTGLAEIGTEENYKNSNAKANLHKNWVKDIENEIAVKNAELISASDEETVTKENEIAILENELLEQQEFESLYSLQAESLKPEQIDVIEEDNSDMFASETTIPNVTNSTALPNNNISENTSTDNDVVDDFSNLKYNNDFTYSSASSQETINTAKALKVEAKELKDKADVKLTAANNTDDEDEKAKLVLEGEDLQNQSNIKQDSVAKIYSDANRAEYMKNTSDYNAIKEDYNTGSPINITIGNLAMDEANNYNEEAKIVREQADDFQDFRMKESLLQQAYELEIKALEAQKNAIVKLSTTDEIIASSETSGGSETTIESPESNSGEFTLAQKDAILALETSEIKSIKEDVKYQDFAKLTAKKRRLVKEAQVEYIKADKIDADIIEEEALLAGLNSVDEPDETENQKIARETQIKEIEDLIEKNKAQSLVYRAVAEEKETEAKQAENDADFILINADENEATNFAAIEKAETFDGEFLARVMSQTVESSTDITEPTLATPNILVSIDEIPTVLKESIFVINKNKAAYSERKKIPVSPKLPEGLVFKVQVGAYRNAIPQSHFKGFAPIMAEDAGNGITRYTAGFFKTVNTANTAKNAIRSIGYSDAFVVAFLNGKRINMIKARDMISGSDIVDNINIETPADNGGTANNNGTSSVSENNSTTNDVSAATVPTEEVQDGVSTDVRNIGGAFYAIQIGVYSKKVTGGQLNNVTPLNSERTASGLIRYTSGVFKTLNEANAAKERIRNIGISDAFVVAYGDGEKITISKAKEMIGNTAIENTKTEVTPKENEVESSINTAADTEVKLEETIEVNPTSLDEETEGEIKKVIEENISSNNTSIKFLVKLGEYTDGVPVDEAGLFLKLTSRGIKNYVEGDKTVYIMGSFSDFVSASELQAEMKEMGVINPVVIAFNGSEEIGVEEAIEIIKKN